LHHDFKVCSFDFQNTNYNQVAIVNEDRSGALVQQQVQRGILFSPDTRKHSDPYWDNLNHKCWLYKEDGTYDKKVNIKNPISAKTNIFISDNAVYKNILVILSIRDNGNPQLTSYRRIVLICKVD